MNNPIRKKLTYSKMAVDGELINIEGYVHYYIEENYGEDADGKRGERHVFIEDVTDVCAFSENGEDLILTDKQRKKAEKELVDEFFYEGGLNE